MNLIVFFKNIIKTKSINDKNSKYSLLMANAYLFSKGTYNSCTWPELGKLAYTKFHHAICKIFYTLRETRRAYL